MKPSVAIRVLLSVTMVRDCFSGPGCVEPTGRTTYRDPQLQLPRSFKLLKRRRN